MPPQERTFPVRVWSARAVYPVLMALPAIGSAAALTALLNFYVSSMPELAAPVRLRLGTPIAWVGAAALFVWLAYLPLGLRMGRRADALRAMQCIDPLTSLPNRHHFDQCVAEFSHAPRAMEPLAVLMVDVDRLKEINDRHGHQAGDEALRLVAASLKQSTRASDCIARYGGDEFVIAAPRTSRADALLLADRIRANLQALGMSRPLSSPLPSVSIGVATTDGLPCGVTPAEALFDAADQALYLSKHNGRDRTSLGRITWQPPCH